MTFLACSPRSSRTGMHSMVAPSGTLRRPCSRSTLKCSRTSPSISSLTRKPKPRVASNHFTRPVIGASSGSEAISSELHYGPTASSGRLYAVRCTTTPSLTCVTVSANRLYAVVADLAPRSSIRSISVPGAKPTMARASAKPCPARTIAASAFSRSCGSTRRRRERPDPAPLGRSAARPRPPRSSAWSRAASPSCSRRPRRRAAARPPAACHSRAPSATRLGKRIGRVVDIAELGEALGDAVEVRLAVPPAQPRSRILRSDRRAVWRGWSRSGRHSASASSLQLLLVERRGACGALVRPSRPFCATVADPREKRP